MADGTRSVFARASISRASRASALATSAFTSGTAIREEDPRRLRDPFGIAALLGAPRKRLRVVFRDVRRADAARDEPRSSRVALVVRARARPRREKISEREDVRRRAAKRARVVHERGAGAEAPARRAFEAPAACGATGTQRAFLKRFLKRFRRTVPSHRRRAPRPTKSRARARARPAFVSSSLVTRAFSKNEGSHRTELNTRTPRVPPERTRVSFPSPIASPLAANASPRRLLVTEARPRPSRRAARARSRTRGAASGRTRPPRAL